MLLFSYNSRLDNYVFYTDVNIDSVISTNLVPSLYYVLLKVCLEVLHRFRQESVKQYINLEVDMLKAQSLRLCI